jgi:hypothetical protein
MKSNYNQQIKQLHLSRLLCNCIYLQVATCNTYTYIIIYVKKHLFKIHNYILEFKFECNVYATILFIWLDTNIL